MAAGRKGVAPNPAPPTLCKVRVRFAKRGRLRFGSHRDVARAFERAVRRAGLPVARSHGFSPHPRLSWVGAAPTGTASEAEYLEIGLTCAVDPDRLVADLDAALPDGLDVLSAVQAVPGGPGLAELINASHWRIQLPQVAPAELAAAVATFLDTETVIVQRTTKNGPRPVDVRAAVVSAEVETVQVQPSTEGGDHVLGRTAHAAEPACAIMTAVVRQTTPAVRPDDVLGALLAVAGLRPPVPAMAVRLAQGLLDDRGRLADPFDAGG
ncbi:MAG TPA: TIGR03936 family radical SAM-associated protein [Pseudonocardia sp.]|uniref:TIGR03936 family radical SAM-associated protein n=1 Tax=Pseudonocardia sp. TaxID=60912 RepID=UPI002C8B33FC|nr:TIGR03936 family radical SAM-associated protein [Pseudonocardia sp.]HTF51483.1 TIGR03936 family radical SAM-associated protein [Pseudonocardia sp.]